MPKVPWRQKLGTVGSPVAAMTPPPILSCSRRLEDSHFLLPARRFAGSTKQTAICPDLPISDAENHEPATFDFLQPRERFAAEIRRT